MNYDYIECGDCLELMQQIPDGSIDLVLCDPPYGTIKGANLDGWENGTVTDWDVTLDNSAVFSELSRVLRQNGKAILFGQEPYTSKLITEAIPSLPFCYRAVWLKNVHANPLMSKKAMVSRYEDICVFYKKHDAECTNELRAYFKKVIKYAGSKKAIIEAVGGKADHTTRVNSPQFSLCTEETYNEIVEKFNLYKMDGFKAYDELKIINKNYESTFNLWEGKKSKANVLEYKKDNDGYHPTQKPVKLLEDLILTFSNVGDVILDFTMGSGSTCVACVNTNRHYIGFELDPEYFDIACKRLDEVEKLI